MATAWPIWIKLRIGWLVCCVRGHIPSRRRGHISDKGIYTTVCRRCEVPMVRRNGKMRPVTRSSD
jgi:hypothetical protein